MTGRALFIAGAHTDIGKTHVACALIRAARARGLSVRAFKPVVSGFDPDKAPESDPGRLLSALQIPFSPAALAAVSPWRFAAPLAPPAAARLEGVPMPFPPVLAAAQRWLQTAGGDLRIVEGVGGLMSPIADRATCLDLALGLGAPVLLVGGSYLGGVSHLLTALEVLRLRGASVLAVVVSESQGAGHPEFSETAAMIAGFAAPTLVVAARRDAADSWSEALLWLLEEPQDDSN